MNITEHTVYTIRHRGTGQVLAEASSEPEVAEKIEVHRGDGDVNLPVRVRCWWREPLSIERTDSITITQGPYVVRQPGASMDEADRAVVRRAHAEAVEQAARETVQS